MRLFVAINFPSEIIHQLTQEIETLAERIPHIHWVKPENLHLTLKFLGLINTSQLSSIQDGVEKSISSMEPFTLAFERFGFWARDSVIIWVSLSLTATLSKLVGDIDYEMKKLGFPTEKRPYFPHVTIGRVRHLSKGDASTIRAWVEKQTLPTLSSFRVSTLTLMESTLTSQGARYRTLATVAFR